MVGLHKQYLKVGQSAKNRLFGIEPKSARRRPVGHTDSSASTIQMLISERGKLHNGRLAVIVLGFATLVLGIVLSCVPWLDYIILKQLRLWNNTLSYHYWQKPGITRLTKVYVFNVTNPDAFLNHGEKPILEEVGPFVYREDMEKVNIAFHDNGTVSFQHHKILRFVPELSLDKNLMVTVPNIPLLTLSTMSNSLLRVLQTMLSMFLRTMKNMTPFVHVSVEELLFGYDDTLVTLANRFFPQHKRPANRMGLLLSRNGTLKDVQTIYTGHTSLDEFGYMTRLNGMDHIPYWSPPCNSIRASEGSFFPPRRFTNNEVLYVWDKDLCRIWPLHLQHSSYKDGVAYDYFTPPKNAFSTPDINPDNKCFCPNDDEECGPEGLQNISPCQFDAPVYISNPHFLDSDPKLLDAVVGLKPDKEKHKSYFKIQPKLGVPLEGQVRIQLNIKVDHAPNIHVVKKFPSITLPIVWVQEGVADLTPNLKKLIYLATSFADVAQPIFSYGCIVGGSSVLIFIFVRAYKNIVFTRETIELGKATLRRGSSFIINGQHRLLIVRDSYSLLNNMSQDPDGEQDAKV